MGNERTRKRSRGILNPAEVFLYHGFHGVEIEIADGDDCHVVRAVPCFIETFQRCVFKGGQNVFLADGHALGILGIVEKHGILFLEDALVCALARAHFFDDDAAFLVDFRVVEADIVSPVLDHLNTLFEQPGFVRRDLQHIYGFIETGVCIQIIAEACADRLEIFDKLVLFEILRPVEGHVLAEMREPLLLVAFQHRSRVHGEAKLRALFGLAVLEDVVRHAVLELAETRIRVKRNRIAERK